MKIINLNESQYSRIFESVTDSNFGTNGIPEKATQDQTRIQTKITKKDGSIEDSNPVTSDMFADMQTPQQWGSVGGRKSSNTI
jgi:hypothetical protein